MGAWLKVSVSTIKAAVELGIEEANKAAEEDPNSILQDVEEVSISVGIYIGESTLDAKNYREAKRSMSTGTDEAEQVSGGHESAHQ